MVSEGGEYGSKSSRQVRKIQSGREPDPHHSQQTGRGSERGERVRLGEVAEKGGRFHPLTDSPTQDRSKGCVCRSGKTGTT